MLDDKMYEYEERFGELFPLMMCLDMTDDEIEARIQSCLDAGSVYEPPAEVTF